MNRHLSALAMLLTLACGPSITADRDPSVPMPAGATWSWGVRDTVSKYELNPAAQNPILHQRVQQSIENTLTRKGWKRVDDPSQAQLIVTYHIGLKRDVQYQTSSTAVGGGWYGGYGWGYYGAPVYVSTTTTPVVYTTGGLLVIVRDRASSKVAWHGLYKKEVYDTARITQEAVQQAVDDLLRELK